MSATELAQVEALIERMLPDPQGFAERVLQQMVDRLRTELPGAESRSFVAGPESPVHEALVDRNEALAVAVGACRCWGDDPRCPICSGEGSAGWTEPDPGLFAEYVEPAVLRHWSADDSAADQPPTEGEGE